jgi:CheY-like chemotaxis protein
VQRDVELILEHRLVSIRRLEVYTFKNGSLYKGYRSGDEIPLSQVTIPGRYHRLPLFSHEAQTKNLSLSYHVGENVPVYLHCDDQRLGQVLTNVIGNAIKFTHQGKVDITVDLVTNNGGNNTIDKPVIDSPVNITQQDLCLHFSISDTGIGMGVEAIATLFDKFTQTDSSSTREYGGTGLGMSISQSLVQLMGGALWVVSELGEGSVFHITCPLVLADKQAVETSEDTAITSYEHLRGCHILVVDDIHSNRFLLEMILEDHGISIDEACDGQEAVEAVIQNRYDAVLMDIQMKVMHGLEATKIIRADAKNNALPIITLTAKAMEGDREECLAAGMNDYTAKPVEVEVLMASLSAHIIVAVQPGQEAAAASPGFLYWASSFTALGNSSFVQLSENENINVSKKWSEFSPSLRLYHSFNDNTLVYTGYSSGFKSGGFKHAGGESTIYRPEVVDSFTLGLKTTILNGRPRVNAEYFYNDYTDKQLSTFVLEGAELSETVANVGEVTTSGAEVELTYLSSVDGLLVGLNVGYLDAEIDSYKTLEAGTGQKIDIVAMTEIGFSPDWSVQLWAEYRKPLAAGELTVATDVAYRSKSFTHSPIDTTSEFSDAQVQPEHAIWNALIAYQSEDQRWRLALESKNLEDKRVLTNSFVVGPFASGGYNAPRTVAFSVAYNF